MTVDVKKIYDEEVNLDYKTPLQSKQLETKKNNLDYKIPLSLEQLEIQKQNCKKYFLLSIVLNPALIAIIGTSLWAITSGNGYIMPEVSFIAFFIILLTTYLIFLTYKIFGKLPKLRKNNLIGKKCFILVYILWLLPFICALLFSGACSVLSLFAL